MAVVAPSVLQLDVKAVEIRWASLGNGDTGGPVSLPHYPDKTVQVKGTFSTGGTVEMEGAPETAPAAGDWGGVHDPQGTLISIGVGATENDPLVLAENPRVIRPNVTAGDGSTDVTVVVIAVAR
jgi:hypothetical protein